MDLEDLQKLIELMNENGLVEVEIEEGEKKVRLKKAGADQPMMPPQALWAQPTLASQPGGGGPAEPVAASSIEGDSITFNSPMVGTFYTSPSPGAEPFVKVGDRISQTTVLCIIEAMKVMNEIQAEMEGEILEVLVGNGEAVEYGQPLFTIKPR